MSGKEKHLASSKEYRIRREKHQDQQMSNILTVHEHTNTHNILEIFTLGAMRVRKPPMNIRYVAKIYQYLYHKSVAFKKIVH